MRAALVALLTTLALGGAAQAQQSGVISNPRMLSGDPDTFVQNYPQPALYQGVVGRVEIECAISAAAEGDCRIISEAPSNWGFGEATLHVARSFQFVPARRDGVAIGGGRVRQTVVWDIGAPEKDWQLPAGFEVSGVELELPQWEEAPNASEVIAATPEALRQRRGRGVLSCLINDDRSLDCETLIEMPRNSGFGAIAMSLAPRFRVANNTAGAAFSRQHKHERFILPINFGAGVNEEPMSFFAGTAPATLTVPAYVTASFSIPAPGRVPGEASILCTIGQAAPCVIESETPPGSGYGRPALVFVLGLGPMPVDEYGFMEGDQIRYILQFAPD